jgi:hypothetical protein
LKTKFRPWNQSPRTTYCTHVAKPSKSFSPIVLTSSTKGIYLDLGHSTTSVSFNTISKVLKTSKACVIVLIKMTFTLITIFGIINGIGLGIIDSSNSFTYTYDLATTLTGTLVVGSFDPKNPV